MSERIRNIDVTGFIKDEYDFIQINYSYTGTMSNITSIIPRINGASGPSVCTIFLNYVGDNVSTISATIL